MKSEKLVRVSAVLLPLAMLTGCSVNVDRTPRVEHDTVIERGAVAPAPAPSHSETIVNPDGTRIYSHN